MHEDSNNRSIRSASLWVLRLALCARAIGLGCSYLWHPMERESNIYGMMYFEWGWPEATALSIENAGMWFVAIGAVIVLLMNFVVRNKKEPEAKTWRAIEIAMLAFITLWEIAMAAGLAFRGGEFLSQWALGSHGLRIAIPASLLLYATGCGANAITRVLYVGTVTTFLVHGAQAWLGSPVFITMIITTAQTYFDYAMEQSNVERILKFIGAMDICVVATILLLAWSTRSKSVLRKVLLGTLLWMAFWGLVTAFGRTTGASFGTFPETLLRLVHLGGPLVLYLEWSRHLPTGSSVAEPQSNVHPLPTCEQPEPA